jgi:hypothetical protein
MDHNGAREPCKGDTIAPMFMARRLSRQHVPPLQGLLRDRDATISQGVALG